MSIIDYINKLYVESLPDSPYYVPRAVPNPNYRVPPTERVSPLREFNINGHTIKAKSRKDALKIAVYKGLISDKKKKKK